MIISILAELNNIFIRNVIDFFFSVSYIFIKLYFKQFVYIFMIHILKIILNSHKKIYAFLLSENNIFHIIFNLPKYHNNSF